MCGAKLANRKNTEDMTNMLGLNQTIDKMAKASGVRWLGNVLRKEDDDVVRSVLEFNDEGRRKRGRRRRTWRKQVEEKCLKAGLNLKDAHNRSKWRERKSKCNFREVNPATSIKWGQHWIMTLSSLSSYINTQIF